MYGWSSQVENLDLGEAVNLVQITVTNKKFD